MAAQRTIACMLFDWQAEASLRAVLTLIRGRTRDLWRYEDGLNADVVIYQPGNTLAEALGRRAITQRKSQLFLAVAQGEDDSERLIRYPFGPNAQRLIRALDEASLRLEGAPQSASSARASLVQRLDDALQQPGVAAIELHTADRSGLLDLANRRIIWPTALKLDEMARLLSDEVDIDALRSLPPNYQSQLGPQAVSSPWDGALWSMGIALSGGGLLRRIAVDRAYRLTRWPDFGVIGRRSLDIRCTALLSQRALTPIELVTLSGVPEGSVHAFINASALCGLLKLSSATAVAPARASGVRDSVGNLFKSLRRALALG